MDEDTYNFLLTTPEEILSNLFRKYDEYDDVLDSKVRDKINLERNEYYCRKRHSQFLNGLCLGPMGEVGYEQSWA